jgi:hypothetical protein
MLWGFLHNVAEPFMVYWPFSMLREKALKAAIGHVHIYISMQDHGWQVFDCTAKGLKVMPQLYQNT